MTKAGQPSDKQVEDACRAFHDEWDLLVRRHPVIANERRARMRAALLAACFPDDAGTHGQFGDSAHGVVI
jgi:hypothetical protein